MLWSSGGRDVRGGGSGAGGRTPTALAITRCVSGLIPSMRNDGGILISPGGNGGGGRGRFTPMTLYRYCAGVKK
jgi:hypothetical protein